MIRPALLRRSHRLPRASRASQSHLHCQWPCRPARGSWCTRRTGGALMTSMTTLATLATLATLTAFVVIAAIVVVIVIVAVIAAIAVAPRHADLEVGHNENVTIQRERPQKSCHWTVHI